MELQGLRLGIEYVSDTRIYSTLKNLSVDNECNKGLLTECEVCTGKYLPEVFVQTERRRSEICAKKQKVNTFPYRPSKEVNKTFITLAFGSFSSLFIALCSRLQYL